MEDTLLQFIEQSNLIEGIEDEHMTKDSLEAWRYLAGKTDLTNDVIKRTQKIIVQNQNVYFKRENIKKHLRKIDKGEYRQEQVSIGTYDIVDIDPVNETITKMWRKTGEVLDFNQIQEEIDKWIITANSGKIIAQTSPSTIEDFIKNCHIGFERIHPFVDGNGRVGRMLLNWQRAKVDLPLLIIWADEKQDYYQWFKGDKKDEQSK